MRFEWGHPYRGHSARDVMAITKSRFLPVTPPRFGQPCRRVFRLNPALAAALATINELSGRGYPPVEDLKAGKKR
jgi:hypothetical protein